MAIGWLTVLKMVPWTDVISNAPKVADGAKKLWGSVGKKSPVIGAPLSEVEPDRTPDAPSVTKLTTRIGELEAATGELHSQMLASSELITTLAEQNTQLIQRVERHRLQLLWLAGVSVVLIATAITTLLLVWR